MSFVPFSGGKRICVGKTFAETVYKVIIPIFLKAYSNKQGVMGTFKDPTHYTNKPHNNILIERPKIFVKLNIA